MARVIWTDPALQDLEQIGDYIALDNPDAAKRLVREVFRKVELLEQFPEMYPVAHDLPASNYRHLSVPPLRIFHRIEGDLVYIIYVMRSERLLRASDLDDRDRR